MDFITHLLDTKQQLAAEQRRYQELMADQRGRYPDLVEVYDHKSGVTITKRRRVHDPDVECSNGHKREQYGKRRSDGRWFCAICSRAGAEKMLAKQKPRGLSTHCRRGHPFTPDNVKLVGRDKQRRCRTCYDANVQQQVAREREKRRASRLAAGSAAG